jgi:tetratricopeptide (TPR) repeat protein
MKSSSVVPVCAICGESAQIELNHAGGRNHIAWFRVPRDIELNANLPALYDQYAFFLQAMGREQEAIAAAHRAVELDPLSPWFLSQEGRILFRARQY